jgi:hypothetical protein
MQAPHPDQDRAEGQSPADQPAIVGPPARRVLGLARRVWNPAPILKPVITTDLEHLDWPERSAAVVAHSILSMEFWLSSGGWVREYIRLSLWIAVVLLVAAVLVIPPVTAVLEGVRDWTSLLSATTANINATVTKLPPIVLALATAFLVVKFVQRHWLSRRRPPKRPDYDQYQ